MEFTYREKIAGHEECCGRCPNYTGEDVNHKPCSFCNLHEAFVCGVCGTCDDFGKVGWYG